MIRDVFPANKSARRKGKNTPYFEAKRFSAIRGGRAMTTIVDRTAPYHPILIYERSLTFSQGNCSETARIRPTKPPPRSPAISDRPEANSRVYLQNPLFNLSSKLPPLCSAASRYLSISPLRPFSLSLSLSAEFLLLFTTNWIIVTLLDLVLPPSTFPREKSLSGPTNAAS